MNTRQIGAIYLIITSNKALLLKRSPFFVISSAIVFGLITQPMRIQVQSATIGIIMLLLKKSKNVRKSIPRILTFDHTPLPSDDGIPIIRQMPITIRQDLIRVSLNLSISEETIASITEIFKETQKLTEIVGGVNDRTHSLAAAAEEITASSDSILNIANQVKESLESLKE